MRILEALRETNPEVRFLQASSSEMFGKALEYPQNEKPPFNPRTPYGILKLFGYFSTITYRETYGMPISNSICFNHESPRRGEKYVIRKVSMGVSKISLGLSKEIRFGNINSKRDWGRAKDYVKAMYMMNNRDKADDYIISTCQLHSIKDLLDIAFNYIGIDNWSEYIIRDPKFYRPEDYSQLWGDSTKIRQELGWKPSIFFRNIIEEMVENDI